jgi:hypothetical protein
MSVMKHPLVHNAMITIRNRAFMKRANCSHHANPEFEITIASRWAELGYMRLCIDLRLDNGRSL